MKNKKGISLIVLVITIIVIIILAAAVILTLNKNNPMNNSKIATLSQNKDSVESGINLYLAQVIANTQGKYSASEILTKKTSAEPPVAIDDAALEYTLCPDAVENVKIGSSPGTAAKAHKINAVALKSATDIVLPAVPSGTWYIDPATSKVYLIFETTAKYPAYITDSIASNTTLQQFVGVK
ncbi:MAG: hypothetical protein RSD14_00450 [Clostridia bacterium]